MEPSEPAAHLYGWPVANAALGGSLIDWSADNRLAVSSVTGGDESQVIILSPQKRPTIPRIAQFVNAPKMTQEESSESNDMLKWSQIKLRANSFPSTFVPPIDNPLPNAHFSTGQEQSESFIAALKWSPSTHLASGKGETLLAVLTSNHVLCIHAVFNGMDLAKAAEYGNIVGVINWELSKRELLSKDLTKRSRQQMIYCFCWSSMQVVNASDSIPQLLAVATGQSEILVLELPQHNESNPFKTKLVAEASDFNEQTSNRNQILKHLSWSSWIRGSEGFVSWLAYTKGGQLYIRKAVFNQNNLSLQEPEQSEFSVTSPLCWNTENETVTLVLLPNVGDAAGHPVSIRFSAEKIENIDISEVYRENNNWLPISGLTVSQTDRAIAATHYSPFLLSEKMTLAQITTQQTIPRWAERINKHRAFWAHECNVESYRITAHVWGIVSSPTREFVATAFSLHFPEGIDYRTWTEQDFVVDISWEDSVYQHPETPATLKDQRRALREMFMWSLAFRASWFETQEQRLQVLKDALDFVLSFPEKERVDLQKSIRELHSYAAAADPDKPLGMLRNVTSRNEAIARLDLANQINNEFPNIIAQHNTVLVLAKFMKIFLMAELPLQDHQTGEKCSTCGENIDYNIENVNSGTCSNPRQHTYQRCAATQLCIQVPHTADVCTLCAREYLSQRFILALASKLQMEDSEKAFMTTVARLINPCIVCGGRLERK